LQTFQKPLTAEEETYYLKESQNGNLDARNLLVERNLRLVAHIVKKYSSYGRDTEDLISTGTIGLIKAINTYDVSKGNKLGTYASRCIENELLMLLRQERKSSREVSLYEPIGADKEGNEIHLMDIMESTSENVLEDLITRHHIQTIYQFLRSALTPREQTVIIMRYGLYQRSPVTQSCPDGHFPLLRQQNRKTCIRKASELSRNYVVSCLRKMHPIGNAFDRFTCSICFG